MTLCNPKDCSTPGFPVFHHLCEFAQTHVHWVDDAMQPSHPLSPSYPPFALSLSQHQGLFRWVGCLLQVAKVFELQCQHQSFQWIPGLISFRIDWFDLLAVQGTLKRLLQYNSSKTSILWCSAFFMVQLSHPYMTTGKTIALTIRTFSAKWCLCFFICCLSLSQFLPRSKHLLTSWGQSPSAVILEPTKMKSVTVSNFSYLP